MVMNDLTKELALKVGISVEYLSNTKQWVLIEALAESIVRECIEVCKSRVGNSDYNTGRMHCVSDLKEHFGVEE
jgi:predicted transcriptional regulator